MKETIIIWVTIILVILSLLFPPFGYTRITVTSFQKNLLTVPPTSTPKVVPWTYVGHRFIFSQPPMTDPALEERFKSDHLMIRVARVDDMRISWPVIAVQIAAIIVVAFGLAFTFRIQRKRFNS